MESLVYLLKVRTMISNIFIAIFGYLLPSLNSAKAVMNADTEGIEEMLCYWSVFSVFVLTESLFDVFLDKLPLYYEVKAIFILYLTMPSTQGAYKLYHRLVKPYFERYEDHIDSGINKVASDAQAVAMDKFKGLAWHLLMNTDRFVLDFLAQCVKYVMNFNPGIDGTKESCIDDKSTQQSSHEDSLISSSISGAVDAVSKSDENEVTLEEDPKLKTVDDIDMNITPSAGGETHHVVEI